MTVIVFVCVYATGCFLGSVGMCTHEIAARLYRTIAVNGAFSIEVIKMIEDSGELIHL